MLRRLFAPIDIAPLVWFRIAFGVIMAVEVWRYFEHGWIYDYYIQPKFFFTYYGFGWVHPWPGNGMYVHFAVLGLLAACIALGLFYRAATVLFFLGFTYVFLLDQTDYLNHFYLVCLYSFLLTAVPAHRAFSLDAALQPKLRSSTVPAWSLWLMRAQICVVYFMGGIAKLNGDWLHGEPMRHWLAENTSFPLLGRYFTNEWMVYAFSWGGLCFDLSIVPLILWRRTRWIGFILAACFNMMNARLFHIGIFPWLALCSTVLLFANYSWLRRLFPRLWGEPMQPRETPAFGPPLSSAQRVTVVMLAAWLAFQIFMPLRHLVFYPGSPEWTEEGHRFAWRMKLADKDGGLTLIARDPATGKTWIVSPGDYLTESQFEVCSFEPDMVQQLARHVASEWSHVNGAPIEVRARARAILNYRSPARLIDPDVDLAAQPRSLRHATWILPLTIPLGQ